MGSATCLNCRAPVAEAHCGHCGQSAATARFTMGRLVRVELARAIFSVDGSFFFTLKQLFRLYTIGVYWVFRGEVRKG
jgi:hypothetical protein